MTLKRIFTILAILGAFCLALLSYSVIVFSPEYMYRIIKYGESDVMDYTIFPERTIHKGDIAFYYSSDVDSNLGNHKVQYTYKGKPQEARLEDLLEETGTTAFIVIKDDVILYETYLNDYTRESINTSFSAAKSVVSLLIGIAIDNGYIQDVHEPITTYITELKGTEYDTITIEDLLRMRSPIKYKEGMLWFGDDAKTYYAPDLRRLAVYQSKIINRDKNNFHYNNYHPLLLGIILERSTGQSVAAFMEEQLYQKLGAEFDASWSLDSVQSGFEKMESGINVRAIDFAKIGSMVLHNGHWQGEQIISAAWLRQSTLAEFPLDDRDYRDSFLQGRETGYGYMWYSAQVGNEQIDIYAIGKYAQVIYISPKQQVVIVRHGHSAGNVDWWPDLLKEIAALTDTVE